MRTISTPLFDLAPVVAKKQKATSTTDTRESLDTWREHHAGPFTFFDAGQAGDWLFCVCACGQRKLCHKYEAGDLTWAKERSSECKASSSINLASTTSK